MYAAHVFPPVCMRRLAPFYTNYTSLLLSGILIQVVVVDFRRTFSVHLLCITLEDMVMQCPSTHPMLQLFLFELYHQRFKADDWLVLSTSNGGW